MRPAKRQTVHVKVTKIVSGGQTGMDQEALQACQWIDFPYGGWVPKGRLTMPAKFPLWIAPVPTGGVG